VTHQQWEQMCAEIRKEKAASRSRFVKALVSGKNAVITAAIGLYSILKKESK
jgi:hypothetical protein